MSDIADRIEGLRILHREQIREAAPRPTMWSELADLIESLYARATAAEAERDETNAIFDMRWAADQRAIARWQAEAPEGDDRSQTWPDHADMVVWLLERLDEAEARAALAQDGTE